MRKIKHDRVVTYPLCSVSDWLLFGLVLVIGSVFAVYVSKIGLALHLVDQFSHLSISRQITDSLTPGLSQVGFWPPLLHMLMTPLAAFDWLYYSDYASAALLVPTLGLAAVFLYRIVYMLTGNRLLGYVGVIALLCNPYVLYFSVTPMTEMLFVVMLLGVTYFFIHWWLYNDLLSLVLCGLFVSMATLARFEGFILIPVVGLALLAQQYIQRRRYIEIEAVATIFGLMALTGMIFILVYGYIYGNDPLAFANNSWGAYAQQRDFVLPGEGNIANAFIYMTAAAITMVGLPLLTVAAIGFVLLQLLPSFNRALVSSVLIILASPYLFDIFAVYQGSAIVYLPQLFPYPELYFNVRYGLFLIGFLILIPLLLVGFLWRREQPISIYRSSNIVLGFLLVAFLISGSMAHSLTTGCADCFTVVRQSTQVSPTDHRLIAEQLREQYDGGFILMTRALHNEVAVRAEIPLQNYILEANNYYFTQALEQPWWYANYVVMFNPNEAIHKDWLRNREEISREWAGNDEFNYFYEPVFMSQTQAIYKLNQERLADHVRQHEVDVAIIPSLQSDTERWNVESDHVAIRRAFEQWHENNS